MNPISLVGLAAIAVVLALASSALLLSSPVLAFAAVQLAFLVLDALAALVADASEGGGAVAPRLRLRVFARFVAATAAAIALRVVTSLAGSTRGATISAWLLPTTAILLALGWAFGAVGGALVSASANAEATIARQNKPISRASLADGALVLFADLVAATIAFALAVLVADKPLRALLVATMALAGALLARSVIVVTVVVRAASKPLSGVRAAMTFVLWLAFAGVALSLARSFVAWSGAGAAVILTFAAVLREARRSTPSAVSALGRASFAWSVATFLALLSILSLTTR